MGKKKHYERTKLWDHFYYFLWEIEDKVIIFMCLTEETGFIKWEDKSFQKEKKYENIIGILYL